MLILWLILPACQTHQENLKRQADAIQPVYILNEVADVYRPSFISYPSPESFSICYGNSCREFAFLSLSETEWASIRQSFTGPLTTAQAEREAIRVAIARFETIVGAKTGTDQDQGENHSGPGLAGQMDCVDESTNTTVYLTLLQNAGLLQWHQVDKRQSRGIMSLQVLHWTGVIRETKSNTRYAVDSWFLDNGRAPFVVPLSDWRTGWKPD